MFVTCTAERVAYRNAAQGLTAPATATWRNPFREWIGAQIRGDFFGYICPGDPERAAALAFRDASVSHVKNGIYGEMFIAAMLAAAAVCDDVMTVIEAGLDEIPEKCRLRRDVEKVLAWRREGLSAQQVMEEIHRCYDEHSAHGWCHTNSNAMIGPWDCSTEKRTTGARSVWRWSAVLTPTATAPPSAPLWACSSVKGHPLPAGASPTTTSLRRRCWAVPVSPFRS